MSEARQITMTVTMTVTLEAHSSGASRAAALCRHDLRSGLGQEKRELSELKGRLSVIAQGMRSGVVAGEEQGLTACTMGTVP